MESGSVLAGGDRRFSPAVQRNRDPILAVLRTVLPSQGCVLELASGSGEHAVFFAPHFPNLTWQSSECHAELRASIEAWQAANPLPNLPAPLALDVRQPDWGYPPASVVAVVCINLIHIAPWEVGLAVLQGSARVLQPDGILYLYGPYRRSGCHTAPSNATFDAQLKQQNPAWGVRDLEAVVGAAAEQGLVLDLLIPMPANNFSIILRRR
jgi:SAM-dependent methyltransferase